MEKGHRPVGEQAIELMRIDAAARVIDVGCGSGWAARLMAEKAQEGRVVGIDVSDEMIRVARESSAEISNVEFQVASAEELPFEPGEFTHAFSMESLYYYADIPAALKEIRRVLQTGGRFVTVVDLYRENEPTHQWVAQLKVPVQLLSERNIVRCLRAPASARWRRSGYTTRDQSLKIIRADPLIVARTTFTTERPAR